MKLSQQHGQMELKDLQTLWKAHNRGSIKSIAVMFDVSETFVSRVLSGHVVSGERRVERELARRGCPGFEAYVAKVVA